MTDHQALFIGGSILVSAGGYAVLIGVFFIAIGLLTSPSS